MTSDSSKKFWSFLIIIIITITMHDAIYSAVIMAEPLRICESSLGSRDEYRNGGARWPLADDL